MLGGADGDGQPAATGSTARLGLLVAVAGMLGVLLGVAVGAIVTVRVLSDGGTTGRAAGSPVDAVAVEGAIGGGGVARVAQAVLPSVVRIDVRGIGVGPSAEGSGASGNASGMVWDAEGHVVTNHHVVAGATAIAVTFADGTTVEAGLIGSDPSTDLAVLEVGDVDQPAVSIAAGAVEVGQLAVVLGSPFGLDGSVSAGVISAVDRPVDLRVPDGSTVRLPGVLQTDAGISPGNSGGPLVDGDGRVIGVASALLGDGLGGAVGFAIPVDIAVDVVGQLLDEGRVRTPWLGVAGTAVSGEVADGLGVEPGVVVERVTEGSPAARAGLAPGDVLASADGDPLRTVDDLVLAVRRAGVGGTIDLTYTRDGTEQVVSITLDDRPDDDGGAADDRAGQTD